MGRRIAEVALGAAARGLGWSPPAPKHFGTVPAAMPPSAALEIRAHRAAGLDPEVEAGYLNTLSQINTLPVIEPGPAERRHPVC